MALAIVRSPSRVVGVAGAALPRGDGEALGACPVNDECLGTDLPNSVPKRALNSQIAVLQGPDTLSSSHNSTAAPENVNVSKGRCTVLLERLDGHSAVIAKTGRVRVAELQDFISGHKSE